MKRIVLLDDYQGVALDYGGWDRVPEEWQLVALEQHGPCPIHRRSFAPVPQAARSHGIPILAHIAAAPVISH